MPTVTIYGYGSQGQAQALNLRDRGWNVRVVLRPNSPSAAAAARDGIPVAADPVATTQQTTVAALLLPDTAQPALWDTLLAPHLPTQALVVFAHGFNIHYRRIVPRPDHDVVLAAPMCPGPTLRHNFLHDRCTPLVTAVQQDATGRAAARLDEFIDGITHGRHDCIPSSFAEETETDLFSEQALLCGGLAHLILAVFDTLVAAGYNPKIAYYTALHETRDLATLFAAQGLDAAFTRISAVARYGALTRGPRVIDAATRDRLHTILAEIQSGTFAQELATATIPTGTPWRDHLITHLHQQIAEATKSADT